MSGNQELAEILKQRGTETITDVIACILAILGMFFLSFFFVPLAALVALFGTIIAVKNKSITGIGINVLAWILILIGLITSPILLALIKGVANSLYV